MAKNNGGGSLSLRRENAVEGGGGIDGARAVVEEIGFVAEFTYGGRHKDRPAAALRVVFRIDGMDKPWEDHYTVGPSEKYEVSDDGYSVTGLGKTQGLNKKSGAFFFLDALQDALEEQGLSVDDYLPETDEGGNSVEPLEGLTVILGNKPFERADGESKDKPVIAKLVLDDAPASKGKSGGKAKASSSDDIEEKTVEAITALLEDTPKIKKSDLANLVYQAHRKDADVKAMMQLCFKDAWLAEQDGFAFDKKKGVVTAE